MATLRRLGAPEDDILIAQGNLASTLLELGRLEEAVRMLKEVYASRVRLFGHDEETLNVALNLSITLIKAGNASESMAFLRPLLPLARRALGADHHVPLGLAHTHAHAVMNCAAASRDELIFAEKLLEDTARRLRRVFGIAHPSTPRAEGDLALIRERLAEL